MTNLETAPPEVVCEDGTAPVAEVLEAREVPLGGIRAMTVRRTLPQRRRSFIGAWCFADHYGPDDVEVTGGMRVPPHPHTGLQTVSWLFTGEIEHRDSLGTRSMVRPGELNLMTAGHGISHSEDSTPATSVLHGVQLWVVLPEQHRDVPPAFTHHVPPVTQLGPAQARVFLGSLAGASSPVPTFSPLLGAELTLPAGEQVRLDVDPTFEHGVLVDAGTAELEGVRGERSALVYHPPGATSLTLRSVGPEPVRVVLLGGEPLGEKIVMWWNFIGRDHEEVVAARARWQAEIGADDGEHPGEPARRFGVVQDYPGDPLPAPALPHQRLLPRR
ncbi:pirin family protein [Actinotalea sp. BY-33]|uniref:Pirin family protein n=1 Tax=Actinotalea soli TaxID=2819234 RepID=A0A939LR38_9CELL|nr:pirin family protein [Actinotalea soli]MBO1752941.1 pirin family protein [Actinotalea soli]